MSIYHHQVLSQHSVRSVDMFETYLYIYRFLLFVLIRFVLILKTEPQHCPQTLKSSFIKTCRMRNGYKNRHFLHHEINFEDRVARKSQKGQTLLAMAEMQPRTIRENQNTKGEMIHWVRRRTHSRLNIKTVKSVSP